MKYRIFEPAEWADDQAFLLIVEDGGCAFVFFNEDGKWDCSLYHDDIAYLSDKTNVLKQLEESSEQSYHYVPTRDAAINFCRTWLMPGAQSWERDDTIFSNYTFI